MSKARLVITAVVAEARSQGEVARAYGVSQGWVSRLVARYRAEGEAAYEPRSRRPKKVNWGETVPVSRFCVCRLTRPIWVRRNQHPGSG
jgi:transposase